MKKNRKGSEEDSVVVGTFKDDKVFRMMFTEQ
jgi:hypothetical protein